MADSDNQLLADIGKLIDAKLEPVKKRLDSLQSNVTISKDLQKKFISCGSSINCGNSS
jgi:hypothetical protein